LLSAVSGQQIWEKWQLPSKGQDYMGMLKKRVKVSNISNPDLFFEQDFWIDTGALHSFVPEDWLEKIKVEPTSTKNLILADGREFRRLFGYCRFEIEGLESQEICPVIFAPKDSMFLIGATTLENFGVEVDPNNKELKPILAIIGGFLASA